MFKRWCYYYISRLELKQGLFSDGRVPFEGLASDASAGDQLMARARHLVQAHGLADQYVQIRQITLTALIVLIAFGLVAGGSAALAALGTGGVAPVNVIWSLLGLLLVPTITLMLWLISLALPGTASPWFGRLWQSMLGRLAGRSALLDAWQACLDVARNSGTLSLWLGLMSHLVWISLLVSVVVTMTAAFSLRHFTFVWETTWLSVDVFVRLATWIGTPATWLGLSIPDAGSIAASGNQVIDLPTVRMQWANWLVGSMAMLGLVPRLLAALLCIGLILRRLSTRPIDTQSPYAQAVLAQIRHDAAGELTDGPAGPADVFEVMQGTTDADVATEGRVVVGVDMTGIPDGLAHWPSLGVIDDRVRRVDVLSRLDQQRPERLLIVVDGGQTPDRGSVALVRELSVKAAQARVLLQPRGVGPERSELWIAKLKDAGLLPVFRQMSQASAWLQGDSP